MMKAVVVVRLAQCSLGAYQVSVGEEGQVVEDRIRFLVVEASEALVALVAYCVVGVAFQDDAFLVEEGALVACQVVQVVAVGVNRDAFHPYLQAPMMTLA